MAANSVAVSSIPYNQSPNLASKLITLERTWTIENIDVITRLINSEITGQPVLYSPIFIAPPDAITTEDKKPVEFQLSFYPKGISNDNKDFVGVYLKLKNHPGLDIMFSHSLVRANGEKSFLVGGIERFEPHKQFGRNDMRRDYLFNPANGYVYNDSLTIYCEVNIIMTEPNKPNLIELQDKYPQPEQLTKSYGKLLDSGSYSDVTFVLVDDGRQEIHAHKLILVAQSRVFADKFKAKMNQKTIRVEIAETRVEVFRQMLKFIYTGKVDGTSLDSIAKDLFICADEYRLNPLKSICEEHLTASITTESNLPDLSEFSNSHNAHKLKAKVLESMHKKFRAQIQDANKGMQVARFLSNLATNKDN